MESEGAGKGHHVRDKSKAEGERRLRTNADPEGHRGRRPRTLNPDQLAPIISTHDLQKDSLNEPVAMKVGGDSHKPGSPNSKRVTNSQQPSLTKLSNGLKESKSVSRDLCKSRKDASICKTSAKASSSTPNQSPEPVPSIRNPVSKLNENKVKSHNKERQLHHSVQNSTSRVDSSQQGKTYSRKEIREVLDTEQFHQAMRKSFTATLKDSLKLHEAGHHIEAVDTTHDVTDENDCSFEEMLEQVSAELRWPTLHENKNEHTAKPLSAKHRLKQVLSGLRGSQDEEEENAKKKSLLKRMVSAKVHPHFPSDADNKPKQKTTAELERIADMFCVETEVQALCRRYKSGNYTEEEAYRLFPKPGVWECDFDDIAHSPEKVVDDIIDLEIHEESSYRAARSRVTQASASKSWGKSSQKLRRK